MNSIIDVESCLVSSKSGPRELGAGMFGCTFKMQCHDQPVAVKVLHVPDATDEVNARREAMISYILTIKKRIRGVPTFVDYYVKSDIPRSFLQAMKSKCHDLQTTWSSSDKHKRFSYTITELATSGEVHEHLPVLSRLWPVAMQGLIFNLLFTLLEIHQAGCLHNDIKPANLVLTKRIPAGQKWMDLYYEIHYRNGRIESFNHPITKAENEPLIIDFGLCVMPFFAQEYDYNAGSPYFLPPEFFLSKRNGRLHRSYASDVWAMGVTIICMICGTEEFTDTETWPMGVPPINEATAYKIQQNEAVASDSEACTLLNVQYVLNQDLSQPLIDLKARMVALGAAPVSTIQFERDYLRIRNTKPVIEQCRLKLRRHPALTLLQQLCAWKEADRNGGHYWAFEHSYFDDIRVSEPVKGEGRFIQQSALPALSNQTPLARQEQSWIDAYSHTQTASPVPGRGHENAATRLLRTTHRYALRRRS